MCDDYNTDDGDGCAGDCLFIETGYTCEHKTDYTTNTMPDELASHDYDTLCKASSTHSVISMVNQANLFMTLGIASALGISHL